jgi:hypothetical protein
MKIFFLCIVHAILCISTVSSERESILIPEVYEMFSFIEHCAMQRGQQNPTIKANWKFIIECYYLYNRKASRSNHFRLSMVDIINSGMHDTCLYIESAA